MSFSFKLSWAALVESLILLLVVAALFYAGFALQVQSNQFDTLLTKYANIVLMVYAIFLPILRRTRKPLPFRALIINLAVIVFCFALLCCTTTLSSDEAIYNHSTNQVTNGPALFKLINPLTEKVVSSREAFAFSAHPTSFADQPLLVFFILDKEPILDYNALS